MDIIEQLSSGLADRIAQAAPTVVGIRTGQRQTSGILWWPDVVIASEQTLGDDTSLSVVHGGQRVDTTLAGRDDGTLARFGPTAVTPEKIEPFRPAHLVPDGIAPNDAGFTIALLTTDIALGISELRGQVRYVSFPAGDRIKEIPDGGLLARGQFAFWSNGREARHIDLQQGFAETMTVLSGALVLPGGVGQ